MTATGMISDAMILALEELTDPAKNVVVEADLVTHWDPDLMCRVAERATEPCSNDYLHGKGVCYGPTGDALCLGCMIEFIEANSVVGSSWSIEVRI